MTPAQRERFDAIAESIFESLPAPLRAMLEEIPVIIDDEPSDEILESLGLDPADDDVRRELCGLHTGVALTERSVESPDLLPTDIHLFREGIVELAGGWSALDAETHIAEEIRVTILHELGHHMGLDEDDLYDLGYD